MFDACGNGAHEPVALMPQHIRIFTIGEESTLHQHGRAACIVEDVERILLHGAVSPAGHDWAEVAGNSGGAFLPGRGGVDDVCAARGGIGRAVTVQGDAEIRPPVVHGGSGVSEVCRVGLCGEVDDAHLVRVAEVARQQAGKAGADFMLLQAVAGGPGGVSVTDIDGDFHKYEIRNTRYEIRS